MMKNKMLALIVMTLILAIATVYIVILLKDVQAQHKAQIFQTEFSLEKEASGRYRSYFNGIRKKSIVEDGFERDERYVNHNTLNILEQIPNNGFGMMLLNLSDETASKEGLFDKAYTPVQETHDRFTQQEVHMLAQTVWGEARGTSSEEQKLVVWTILQRVDSDQNAWPSTIAGVITQIG